jgi:hypothetical protein
MNPAMQVTFDTTLVLCRKVGQKELATKRHKKAQND